MSTQPTTIDTELLDRARRVATSTWSDALDGLSLHGVIDGLSVQAGGSGAVAGIAVTIRESVHDFDLGTTAEFDVGRILSEVHTASFLAIDVGGANVSTFGGLFAMAAERAGARGVVIDGACRDLEEVRRSGLLVVSRSVTPRSGKGRLRVEAINARIKVGGVSVDPGDVLIGDATGVVRIPREHFAKALALAEDLARRDAQFAAGLHTSTFAEVVRKLGSV